MAVLDQFRLDGRVAVITGGSRGLGRAMAQGLAEAGADLILIGRDQQSLEAARHELAALGRWVAIVPGDVSTPQGAETACEQVLQLNRPVDILINNVGGRRLDVAVEDMPIQQWQELFDLNLTSALICSQKIGRGMLERGRGCVINVTSIAGPWVTIPNIRGRHYETAKAALTALTRAMAADWAPRGVRVNAIAPGAFLTDANRRWFTIKPEFQREFERRIPMARLGEPAELAATAVFLASDAASYVTGATLIVDGGYTLW
ncbi:MAG: SDR family NAD(P)-dependent oxidoreductase [Gemmataceae bacterium]|nr:SDR family oxidoreductase [Gemmata sp.]MDW8196090.1 SDR family NAD(P)-dependent oxidoreductase [Gemmataceae bacterium]